MNIACCSLLVSRPKGMAVGNGQLHFPAVRQYGLYILGYTFLDDNKEMSANNFLFNQSFVNFSEHNEQIVASTFGVWLLCGIYSV